MHTWPTAARATNRRYCGGSGCASIFCHPLSSVSVDDRLCSILSASDLVTHTDIVKTFRSGQRGDLNVIIRFYVANVECDHTTPFADGGTCAKAVDTIPTTEQDTTFTRRTSPSPPGKRQVEIPVGGKVFSERKSMPYMPQKYINFNGTL